MLRKFGIFILVALSFTLIIVVSFKKNEAAAVVLPAISTIESSVEESILEEPEPTPPPPPPAENSYEEIDFATVKPNESGRIMIHMIHNVIPEYKGGDKKDTMTTTQFRGFLEKMYAGGYRPISMTDYIKGHITTPAGFKPTVLSFDDGWASQFQLVEIDGKLVADPNSAVGILEQFNAEHPDFELKGIFYTNFSRFLTFGDVGTMEERLRYLLDLGFEIGNHTFDHKNLKKADGPDDIAYQVGMNEKFYFDNSSGEKMSVLSLPYGETNESQLANIIEGVYQDVPYHNIGIVLASGGMAPSPHAIEYNPYGITRLLAPGIEPLYMDSNWWIENVDKLQEYVSDGNPDRIVVPECYRERMPQENEDDSLNIVYYQREV